MNLSSLSSKIKDWLDAVKRKIVIWVVCQAIMAGYKKVTAAHLGSKLNEMMDKKFGKDLSDPAQKDIAALLRLWADELIQDSAPPK